MKFYGNGVVWDKENNKVLCRFVRGEYETEDKRIATVLQGLGYKNNGQEIQQKQEEINDEGVEFAEMTYNELKELAKAEGVAVGRKNKVALIEALKEGE